MTVWVVYRQYDHNDHGTPQGVFSSYEKAREWIRTHGWSKYELWQIEPFELDEI